MWITNSHDIKHVTVLLMKKIQIKLTDSWQISDFPAIYLHTILVYCYKQTSRKIAQIFGLVIKGNHADLIGQM